VGLSKSALVVRHDYQTYLDQKLRAQNPELRIVVLESPGSLVIPEVYLKALARLKTLLGERFPEMAPQLETNFELAASQVEQTGPAVRQRIDAAGLPGSRALASGMQADFLSWAGVEVCGSFTDSPDGLSVLQLKDLVSTAAARQAEFVAGNLQSGGEPVARAIAAEAGLPVCILSNFPGTNEHNSTWYDLLLDNLDRLAQARLGSVHP
jgi:ABC-type Zn uptake system ZnuABC Zn-binding protein ZnuA